MRKIRLGITLFNPDTVVCNGSTPASLKQFPTVFLTHAYILQKRNRQRKCVVTLHIKGINIRDKKGCCAALKNENILDVCCRIG